MYDHPYFFLKTQSFSFVAFKKVNFKSVSVLELSFTAFQKLDILTTLLIYLFYVGCTCVLEITKSTKKEGKRR